MHETSDRGGSPEAAGLPTFLAKRIIANRLRTGNFFFAQRTLEGEWFWDYEGITTKQLLDIAEIATRESERRKKARL